ncbi:hypothetical protein ACFLYD_05580 [Chloroflexota bacterium]
MKAFWKIVGIATLVAVLGVTVVGGVALAQDAGDGAGLPFDFRARFRDAIAGILDIDVQAYDAAVEQAQGQVLDEALSEGWLTEDQADKMRERLEEGVGPRGLGGGVMGPRLGFMGGREHAPISVAAEQLGMSQQDLLDELKDGKSIADVAREQGVDPQTIADAYLAQLAENLAKAVEDGKLTQKQADWMWEQAEGRVTDQLDQTWQGMGPGGFPGRKGPGMRPGLLDQTDA